MFLFNKKIHVLTILSCILVFICIGCAYRPQVKKEITSPAYCPGDPTSLKYIDNFNDGGGANMIGGSLLTRKGSCSDAELEISYDKKVRIGRDGYSLRVDYSVKECAPAEVVISLNKLDISAGLGISFWIRGAKADEEFDVVITDWKGHEDSFKFSDLFTISKRWQQVTIEKEKFNNVDFNYMGDLIFKFRPTQTGTIYIDDIHFYGPSYVFFHSIKDNLRNFPTKKLVDKKTLLRLSDKRLLRRIAKDTWRYFDEVVDKRHDMICDYIDMNDDRIYRIGDYTSTTNLGLYFMCIISAWDLGFITRDDAIQRIDSTFDVILGLPRWKDQWYNFYSTTNLQIARPYVSSVDNGWLAAGLIVVRQTFPDEFHDKATVLLEKLDFSLLYDDIIGQLYLGYEADKDKLSDYHYGMIATEPRLTSFIAIGKGDISKGHWFRIYRTLPSSWDWQRQIPKGRIKRYMGIDVFEGYYTYDGMKIVPSWGGSLFETLMPTIVMDEEKYASKSFGLNNKRIARIHRDYMLKEKGYPVWGLSSCSTPDGGYAEFGVADAGTKGYEDFRVITPHASILALPIIPHDVIDNIRSMIKEYDIYGEYGLYDAVNVDSGEVSYRYLCLDQGMIFIQINNYLNDGIMRERFHQDPIAKEAIEVLEIEEFFN